ncbi:hypothetical protein AAFN88_03345 [Pelagibius sp. CAU 1746]|uniref:hypothetical protein n=1 Tax=Pelagibius sp. CAU 1746 TaxID=3140370 RepID=UPI00325C29F8
MVDLEFVGDYRNPQKLTARQRELGFDGQSDGDFSFDDFLDIINPLQHIPLVSTLYREITGDEIGPAARILGDTLFGGPSGFIAAAANAFYEEVAGEDFGASVLAFFGGEEKAADQQFAGSDVPGGGAASDPAAAVPAGLVIPAAAPLATAAGPATAPMPHSGSPSHSPNSGVSSGELPPAEESAMTGMLTGQDALNALFNDLRRSPAAGPAMPTAAGTAEAMPLPQRGSAAKSYPLPPRAQPPAPAPERRAEAASHPLIMAQGAAEADVAQRMMDALDKYRLMSQAGGSPDAASPADKPEEAAWRRDPDPNDPWRFDPAVPPGGS